MKLRIVRCNRCLHEWSTRRNPVQCPKCKSSYWNKPRIRKRKKV